MEGELGIIGYQPDEPLLDGQPPQEDDGGMSREAFEKGLWIEIYLASIKAGNSDFEHIDHANQFIKDMNNRWGES